MLLLIIGMTVFAGGVYLAMENASISRKQIQSKSICAVGSGAFGGLVHFHEDAINTSGDGRSGQCPDELRLAA